MNIQEFITVTNNFKKDESYLVRPEIVCNDGFSFSVQGSKGHYCSPRQLSDNYTSLEIGYPSQEEILILKYADDQEDPTNTVYGHVPTDTINDVLKKHNGINIVATFFKTVEA